MDKARWLIILSVPIAMTFEWFALENVCGRKIDKVKLPDSTISYDVKETVAVNEKKASAPEYFKPRKKLTVAHFPKPAAHTFVGYDADDDNAARQAFEDKGTILK